MAYTKVEMVEVERNGWTKILEFIFTGFGQGSDVRIEEEDVPRMTQIFLALVKLDERWL